MNLEEMKTQIGLLVKEKGFGDTEDTFPQKLFFAFIELAEAGDNWKKQYKKFTSKDEYQKATAEELIDVIFYVLDAARVGLNHINMDEMFEYKLNKNHNRPFRYGEGFTK